MGLSIRAYARQRGVSHGAVLRAIKTGRVPLEPDGTVDAAEADAWCPLRSALEGPSSWTSLLWSLERRGAQAELPFCVWAHPIP